MKCAFCETETLKGIGGPKVFVCLECVEDLSVAKEIEAEGTCSWCGVTIGKVKGFFRRRKIGALAVNPKSGIILCTECGQLCRDIVKNEVQA